MTDKGSEDAFNGETVGIDDGPLADKRDEELACAVLAPDSQNADNANPEVELGEDSQKEIRDEFADVEEPLLPSIAGESKKRPAADGASGEPEASRPRLQDPKQLEVAANPQPIGNMVQMPMFGPSGQILPQLPQMMPIQQPLPPEMFQQTGANQMGANMGTGSNLLGQPVALREMQQFAQFGMSGSLPENAAMSQNFLNQQFFMAGNPFVAQGQFPFGFPVANPAFAPLAMAQFSANQGINTVGGTPGQPHISTENVAPAADAGNATGAQAVYGDSSTLRTPDLAGMGAFGGRPGFIQGVGGFGIPPGMAGQIPDPAAMQQMMFQRGGLSEADMMRQRMMLAGGLPPGPATGVYRPSFLAGTGFSPMMSLAPQTPAFPLALACDDEHLSEYQILVRKQLECFEAQPEDAESNTQGRKKSVSLGQIGIRCRHCASLPLRQRGRGSIYYPSKLSGVYQAAQNMAATHLCEACQCIDESLKEELKSLRDKRESASGGKQYWADGARAIGLYEAEDGLRLRSDVKEDSEKPSTEGTQTDEKQEAEEQQAEDQQAEEQQAEEQQQQEQPHQEFPPQDEDIIHQNDKTNDVGSEKMAV